jgi:hypothetical protein|tara:strand:+ start:645 stop:863 length:219 start_codon:yes stop_codon:yes gene_type:complete
MIEVVFAILMISNGEVIEYVPTSGMADCLEQKRIVTRQIGEDQAGVAIQCKQVTAEIEIDMGNRKRILKIID